VNWMLLSALVALVLSGCCKAQSEMVQVAETEVSASALGGQRARGKPYEVIGSEVWDVPDPVTGRTYQVFVALPPTYNTNPDRRYPVLYVTDADYGFPIIRQIGRRLNGGGQKVEDHILVGLSYALGEDSMSSRRRDYTPTPAGAHDAPPDAVHGKADAYLSYVRRQVLPFVDAKYRVDEKRRYYLGHSYGGLLGAQILLTDPEMFSGYVLGSPSLWYDQNVVEELELKYATRHRDLPASVYIYVGEFEDMNPADARYAKRYNMVSDAKRLERLLSSRGYPSLRIKLDVLSDEDHLSVAPRGFTGGLKFLLGVGAR
jgi:predicted alpha/beta superfamily hydrolase